MTKAIFALALVLYSLAGVAAEDQEAATAVARHYSNAIVSGDLEALVRVTHPLEIMSFGGERGYRKAMDLIIHPKDQSLKIIREDLGTPGDEFSSGPTRMFAVPIVRIQQNGQNLPLYYTLVSYDRGVNWVVFDLVCTDDSWLHALAPAYKGRPILIVTPPEDLAVPEFLKGPRAWSGIAKSASPAPSP